MSTFDSVFRVLTTTSPMEDMRRRLTKKLQLMEDFAPGWSYGEGLPVSKSATALAKDLVLVASDLELKADVFPNLDGGCAVAFYRSDERVEVSVNPDGSLDLTVEKGFGSDFVELAPRVTDVSFRQAIACVMQLLGPSGGAPACAGAAEARAVTLTHALKLTVYGEAPEAAERS